MMTQRGGGILFPQSDLSGLIDWHLSPDHNYSACELLDTVPIAILFVCTANICRSPMAEGVFRSMARRAGLASAFSVDSAGTFDGYVGKPPAPARLQGRAP